MNVAQTPLLTFPHAEVPSFIRAKALVFRDPRSRALLAHVGRIAASDANVLVAGETGTGKELIARHIHDNSRRSGPFLAVNCGAFAQDIVEAELFGHESGAFTGATQARAGWFEAANGGTLFLDEIGDLPLNLQVKLLRVLQERQVVRLGSRKSIAVDVRLIAATNVDLLEALKAGRFRADLYYRLNVAHVELPPLAQRPGDILPLAQHFIDVYRRRLHGAPVRLSAAAERALLTYGWPGNIRELENVIHYAMIVCEQGCIDAADLRFSVAARPVAPFVRNESALMDMLAPVFMELFEIDLPARYAFLEKLLIEKAFEHCEQNQVQTAKLLGISRNVLRAHLKRFGVIASSLVDNAISSSATQAV